jgi:diguanylate cyclase (GGDEF)-like protein/PAS domain S-box-containing protein
VTQNRLRSKQQELSLLIDHIPSAVYQCEIDKDWTMRFISKAIYDISGYHPGELLQNKVRTFESIIHEDDTNIVKKVILDAVNNNNSFELDYRLIHKNGQTIWVNEKGKTILNENHHTILEGVVSNITAEKEQYNTLLKFVNIQDSIVILSDGNTLKFANQSFFDFFGYEDLIEFLKDYQCICERFVENDIFFHLGKIQGDKSNWINEIMKLPGRQRIVSMQDKSMVYHAFTVSISQYDNELFILNFSDITDNMTEKLQLKNQVIHDPLTNAYNRTYFNETINSILDTYRNKNKKASIIFFDIDHFKQVNDTYGHKVGDSILISVVNLVTKHIREKDYLIRWGGEEFIIITSSDSLKDTYKKAEQIRLIIENYDFEDVKNLTCSFGIAVHQYGEDINNTIKNADDKLYEAKSMGRNKVAK